MKQAIKIRNRFLSRARLLSLSAMVSIVPVMVMFIPADVRAQDQCLKIIFSDKARLAPAQQLVFTRIYERAGLCMTPLSLPNKRGDVMLRRGEVDGDAFGKAARIDANAALRRMPTALLQDEGIILSGRDFTANQMNELAGRRIGVKLGTAWEDALRNVEGINVLAVTDRKVLLPMLVAGRVDAVAMRRLHLALFREDGLAGLADSKTAFVLGPVEFHHSLLVRHQHLLARLDAATLALQQEGQIPVTADQWVQLVKAIENKREF